jgi:hypothetical protein
MKSQLNKKYRDPYPAEKQIESSNEKETRTKTDNPFNANIISFEPSAFAIV